jgi:DNA-binding transcriptional regulator GbsR (MarR family)
METNILALGHQHERRELQVALADARTFLAQARQFNLLTTYEQRINRSMHRNMKLLRELQAERQAQRDKEKAQHDQAMEEAKLLAQLNLMEGLPYQPEQNGFVFSAAEVNRAIDRDNRLKAAKLASTAPSPHRSSIARAA